MPMRSFFASESNENQIAHLKRTDPPASLSDLIHQPEAFRQALDALPEQERLSALMERDQNDYTVFWKLYQEPNSLNFALALLPEEDRLEAVQESDAARHLPAGSLFAQSTTNIESFHQIAALYPDNATRFSMLQHNVQNYANAFRNIDLIVAVFDLSPSQKDFFELLKTIRQPTARNEAKYYIKAERRINDEYEESSLFRILIQNAVTDENKRLPLLLSLPIPDEIRIEAVQNANKEQNVLYMSANNSTNLRALLSFYPDNASRIKAIEQTVHSRNTLHQAVPYPESLKLLLEFFPNEATRLKIVTKSWSGAPSILTLAKQYPETMLMLLNLIPSLLSNSQSGNAQPSSSGGGTAKPAADGDKPNSDALQKIIDLLLSNQVPGTTEQPPQTNDNQGNTSGGNTSGNTQGNMPTCPQYYCIPQTTPSCNVMPQATTAQATDCSYALPNQFTFFAQPSTTGCEQVIVPAALYCGT